MGVKSENKIKFRGRWVLVSSRLPTQWSFLTRGPGTDRHWSRSAVTVSIFVLGVDRQISVFIKLKYATSLMINFVDKEVI